LIPGSPVIISLPHFYLGDPKYVTYPIGLKPSKEKHETFLEMEPVSLNIDSFDTFPTVRPRAFQFSISSLQNNFFFVMQSYASNFT